MIENVGVYGGQGTPTLTLTGADRDYHLNRYYVRVSGACEPPVQSDIATLYVENPPEVTEVPVNDTICEFGTATFEVEAALPGRDYQWYESRDSGVVFNALTDDSPYIGTTARKLRIFNVNRSYNGYQYRVIVSGNCAPDAEPAAVELTVNTPPVITVPPVDALVCDGDPAVFSVTAEGSELEYQWKVRQRRWTGRYYGCVIRTIAERLTATLTKLTTDVDTENGYRYSVEVSGPCTPSVESVPVFLTITRLPNIDAQPEDQEVCMGKEAFFEAQVSGPP